VVGDKSFKVIYLSGYGRSGSTMLDIVLSSQEGHIGCGELCNLFQYVSRQDAMVKGMWADIAHRVLIDNKVSIVCVEKYRLMFETYFVGYFCKFIFRKKFNAYKNIWRAVFVEIVKREKSTLVIDSSKTAWRQFHRPFILRDIIGKNFCVIHLERDLKSVRLSMQKGDNVKMEKGNDNVKMLFPSLRATLGQYVSRSFKWVYKWTDANAFYSLEYRDFINHPIKKIEDIERCLAVDFVEVKGLILSGSKFRAKNQFSGNRMKATPFYLRNTSVINSDEN
jgi:hypothetical protein